MPGRTVSRRMVVGLLGSGVALAPAVAKALSTSIAVAAPEPTNQSAAMSLIAPLHPGEKLGVWTIASVRPLEQGAVTVVLLGEDGHTFCLEILARDSSPLAPRPPAETRGFAVFVRNGGDGWVPTVEEQGLAAMALATFIKANEPSVSAAGFLTHEGRIAAHPASLLRTEPRTHRRTR